MKTSDSPVRLSAFSLLPLGWSVFPCWWIVEADGARICACPKGANCDSPGKHPRTPQGVKDATSKQHYVELWWTKHWPLANLAVACGPSNIFVIDVDPRHDGRVPAGLPDTLRADTGGGGTHLFFRQPDTDRIGNRTSIVDWPGVDIRGDGGYVLVAPSSHVSGGSYRWQNWGTPIAEAPSWVLERCRRAKTASPGGAIGANTAGMSGLSRSTMAFLLSGAGTGERNNRLFLAACDMHGCGVSHAEAEPRLMAGAAASGFDESFSDESARQTIRSAFAQARQSGRERAGIYDGPKIPVDPKTGELMLGHFRDATKKVDAPIVADVGGAIMDRAIREDAEASSPRPTFSNIARLWREKTLADGSVKRVPYTIQKPPDAIIRELLEVGGGWPKVMGGIPFVILDQSFDARPQFLPDPPSIFAWIGQRTRLYWSGDKCEDALTGDPLSPMTRAELGETIVQSSLTDHVIAHSNMPHYPPIRGFLYGGEPLPPPDDKVLDDFLAMFNPETPADLGLIESMILTLFAGLEPGRRPCFVLASDYGQGAGKTATAQAVGALVGGETMVPLQDSWTDTCKQIASSDKGFGRMLLFDNIKGRFEGSALEAAVTAKWLSGWKAYIGSIGVPNVSTIVVTANMPELSRDLAERAVIIRIGAPQHGKSFAEAAAAYVGHHRAVLIATCIARLAAEPVAPVPANMKDRWQSWQAQVLTRCRHGGGIAALAALVAARRPAADYEGEERQDLIEAIYRHCRDVEGWDGEAEWCSVTGEALYGVAQRAGVWTPDKAVGARQDRIKAMARIMRLCPSKLLPEGGAGVRIRQRITLTDGTSIASRVYRVDMREAAAALDGSTDDGPPV